MAVSLDNECVLVVGASSGVGRETAVLFARAGAKVMASARRADRLDVLKTDMAKEGHPIEVHVADASDPGQMESLAKEAVKRLGRVDICVYASGTNTKERALTRLSVPVWKELIDTNLNGAFYLTQALLPAMRAARKGHLIYVSSISGLRPDVSGAAYQASKRGMNGLAHAIRVEEKENRIRTCVVCPGLIDSEILDKRPVKPPPEMLAQALQPVDVAEVILDVARMNPRVTVAELEIVPTTI